MTQFLNSQQTTQSSGMKCYLENSAWLPKNVVFFWWWKSCKNLENARLKTKEKSNQQSTTQRYDYYSMYNFSTDTPFTYNLKIKLGSWLHNLSFFLILLSTLLHYFFLRFICLFGYSMWDLWSLSFWHTESFNCSTWILSCSMWNLVPWPEIEPRPPALGV